MNIILYIMNIILYIMNILCIIYIILNYIYTHILLYIYIYYIILYYIYIIFIHAYALNFESILLRIVLAPAGDPWRTLRRIPWRVRRSPWLRRYVRCRDVGDGALEPLDISNSQVFWDIEDRCCLHEFHEVSSVKFNVIIQWVNQWGYWTFHRQFVEQEQECWEDVTLGIAGFLFAKVLEKFRHWVGLRWQNEVENMICWWQNLGLSPEKENRPRSVNVSMSVIH